MIVIHPTAENTEISDRTARQDSDPSFPWHQPDFLSWKTRWVGG